MGATTAYGLPYPEATDFVADGAAAIQALAEAVDTDLAGEVTRANAAYVAQTLADAKGDLIAATGADTFARLPVGANGTVLKADSSQSSGLAWGAAGSGSVVQIGHTTLAGAAGLAFVSIPATYRSLLLVWEAKHASASVNLHLFANNSIALGLYEWTRTDNSGTALTAVGSASDSKIVLGTVNTVADGGAGRLLLPNYASTTRFKKVLWEGMDTSGAATTPVLFHGGAQINTAAALDRLDIAAASGLLSGEFTLYGITGA